MRKLAIFDLDGTLLNTLEDLAQAGNHLLSCYGYPTHPVEAYRYFVGNGIRKLVERILPQPLTQDEDRLEQLRQEFNIYYRQHDREHTAPYPGILEMLDGMREKGVFLAVLSNKPDAFTRQLCADFFGDRFQLVRGQREGYPVKPDPMLVEELLRETGFSAEQSLYVGDSGVDMQTAKNGGLYAAGVLWGFREAKELLENGADILVHTPEELLMLV